SLMLSAAHSVGTAATPRRPPSRLMAPISGRPTMARRRSSRAPGADFADRLQQRGENEQRRKQLAATIAAQAQQRAAERTTASVRQLRDVERYLEAAHTVPL